MDREQVGYTVRKPDWPAQRLDEQQLELPEQAPCIGPELVGPHDVRWLLRSRDARQPAMRLRRGTVRGFIWLDTAILADIENESARVRGLVHYLDVVWREPFLHEQYFIPDGLEPRRIHVGEDGQLVIGRSSDSGPGREVPCSGVTLQRRVLDTSDLLPKAVGQVIVDQAADIQLAGETEALAKYTVTRGSHNPLGALATVHAGPPVQGRAWVSLGICGGTLYGTVATAALLGPSRETPWRLERCLDPLVESAPEPPALERPLRCDRDLTLYLNQQGYLDAIGVVKAGARIQIEGAPHQGRVFVKVADAPVDVGRVACLELGEAAVKAHCRAEQSAP